MAGGQQILGSRLDFVLPLPILLAVQGLLAAGIGQLMGLAKWWFLLNLAVPAAVVLALSLNLPGWIYPLLFAVLALVFWNSADDRVPLYLTNRTTWQALQDLIAAEFAAKTQSGETGTATTGLSESQISAAAWAAPCSTWRVSVRTLSSPASNRPRCPSRSRASARRSAACPT